MAALVRPRLEHIDALRGLAALYVVMHHVYLAVYGDHPGPQLLAQLGRPLLYGRAGVDLFLVVSGFVLYQPIASGRRELEPYGRFMLRRAWRIVPPYYAAIAFSLLLLACVPGLSAAMPYGQQHGLEVVMTHLLMVNNLGGPGDMYGIDYPLWTIPLEFQLYLAFPLLARLATRLGFLRVACLALGFTLLSRLALGRVLPWLASMPRQLLEGFVGAGVPGYLAVFVAGIAAAFVLAQATSLRPARWLAAGLACWGLGVAAWHLGASFLASDTLWGLGSALCLVAIDRGGWLRWPWLAAVGQRSYSLYLLHAPLLACALLLPLGPLAPWLRFTLLTCGWVPLVLLAAAGFYRFVERPFLGAPPGLR